MRCLFHRNLKTCNLASKIIGDDPLKENCSQETLINFGVILYYMFMLTSYQYYVNISN